jgi:hypothetical protein
MARKILSTLLSVFLVCALLGAATPALATETEREPAPAIEESIPPVVSDEDSTDTTDSTPYTPPTGSLETPEDATGDEGSDSDAFNNAAGTEDTAQHNPVSSAEQTGITLDDEAITIDETDGEQDDAGVLEALATSPPVPPTPSTLVPGTYYIRPAFSHTRVLDVVAGSKASRANIQLWSSNKSGAQRFKVTIDQDGYYVVVNEQSDCALDVTGATARQDTNVQQFTQNKTNAQRWSVRDNADGSFTLISSLNAQLALDVWGAKDADGTNIQIHGANKTPAQSFFFIPVNPQVTSSPDTVDGVYTIVSALPGSPVLDIPGASDSVGARLQLYSSNNSAAQMFHIQLQDDGFYLIRSMASGQALDVWGSSVVATAAVQQYSSNNTAAQRWAIRKSADGKTVTFISKASGLALDVTGGRSAAGTPLQQYYPNGTNAQIFRLELVDSEPFGVGYTGCVSIIPYVQTGSCVDIVSASRTSGANAQTYQANGTVAQKFEVLRLAPFTYAFRSLASGQYLTQEGSNVCQRPALRSNGLGETQKWRAERLIGGLTLINLETQQAMTLSANDIRATVANGSDAQIFRVTPVTAMEPGCYVISAATGLALDVACGSSDNGANVWLYAKNNSGAQKWNLTLDAEGYFTIANAASKKALDIANGSTAEGANVWQWGVNGTAAQKWRLVPSGDGWFYLQSKSGSFLTAANGGASSGANVFASRTNTAGNAQKYTFTVTTYIPPPQYSGTYADVNLTTQKMFFIKNGVKVLETDIVTGAPSMATPTGTFTLKGKSSPAVLVGPGYRSPVTYWMPFNGGIGFHDATWQPWFGGNRYLTNGSHGCINMPLSAAKTLYSSISVGDTVRVHR